MIGHPLPHSSSIVTVQAATEVVVEEALRRPNENKTAGRMTHRCLGTPTTDDGDQWQRM